MLYCREDVDEHNLEYAAQAVGIDTDVNKKWNPIKNKKDAFNLAVDLGIVLDTEAHNKSCVRASCNTNQGNIVVEEFYAPDVSIEKHQAIVRRAIVRVAAEVCKKQMAQQRKYSDA